MVFLKQERSEWLGKFKKYFVDLANSIDVNLEDSKLIFKFEYSDERRVYADRIYKLFEDLSKIYDNHPIFGSEDADKHIAMTGLQIHKIYQYFSKLEKSFIFINDYISQMEGQCTKMSSLSLRDLHETVRLAKKLRKSSR